MGGLGRDVTTSPQQCPHQPALPWMRHPPARRRTVSHGAALVLSFTVSSGPSSRTAAPQSPADTVPPLTHAFQGLGEWRVTWEALLGRRSRAVKRQPCSTRSARSPPSLAHWTSVPKSDASRVIKSEAVLGSLACTRPMSVRQPPGVARLPLRAVQAASASARLEGKGKKASWRPELHSTTTTAGREGGRRVRQALRRLRAGG
jgi:hypothetical protein